MTFFEKYDLVRKSVPIPAAVNRDSVDCDYANYVNESKNCYFCFSSYRIVDSLYTKNGWGNKLVDCLYITESEKCYECVDSNTCLNSTYLMDCNSSRDCHFSSFLNSCSDCFGCVALTHKKYCIFNKQYTKEEYFKRVEELRKESSEKMLVQLFALKKTIPHPASQQSSSANCPYGNYIYNAKSCYWAFNSYYTESSGFLYFCSTTKNCWDMFQSGGDPERKTFSEKCYENINSDYNYESAFLTNSNSCTNCYYSYSEDLVNCTDCFGCVGLTKKKYCVYNNQLTKEQYERAVREIKKELGWKV